MLKDLDEMGIIQWQRRRRTSLSHTHVRTFTRTFSYLRRQPHVGVHFFEYHQRWCRSWCCFTRKWWAALKNMLMRLHRPKNANWSEIRWPTSWWNKRAGLVMFREDILYLPDELQLIMLDHLGTITLISVRLWITRVYVLASISQHHRRASSEDWDNTKAIW